MPDAHASSPADRRATTLRVQLGRTAHGMLNVDFPGVDESRDFWRLAYLLLTEFHASPTEHPLRDPWEAFWIVALPDGARLMLHYDTMAGSCIWAENAESEPSLRMLVHDLVEMPLPAVRPDTVRATIERSLAVLPAPNYPQEEREAAIGWHIVVGLAIGAVAPTLASGVTSLLGYCVGSAVWRRFAGDNRPGARGFVQDALSMSFIAVFSIIALIVRALVVSWWGDFR